jgi:hypothetical protein
MLVTVYDFLRHLLQRQQFVGAEIPFVVGCANAWENRFVEICHVISEALPGST